MYLLIDKFTIVLTIISLKSFPKNAFTFPRGKAYSRTFLFEKICGGIALVWCTTQIMSVSRAGTVARWPKLLQNNSKSAAKNVFWPRKFGGRLAPQFWPKWQKRNWNTFSTFFYFFKNFCCEFGLIIKYFNFKPLEKY